MQSQSSNKTEGIILVTFEIDPFGNPIRGGLWIERRKHVIEVIADGTNLVNAFDFLVFLVLHHES